MPCRIVDLPLKPPPTAAEILGSGWSHAIFAEHTKALYPVYKQAPPGHTRYQNSYHGGQCGLAQCRKTQSPKADVEEQQLIESVLPIRVTPLRMAMPCTRPLFGRSTSMAMLGGAWKGTASVEAIGVSKAPLCLQSGDPSRHTCVRSLIHEVQQLCRWLSPGLALYVEALFKAERGLKRHCILEAIGVSKVPLCLQSDDPCCQGWVIPRELNTSKHTGVTPVSKQQHQFAEMLAWAGLSHCQQMPQAQGQAMHCAASGCPPRMQHAASQLLRLVCSTAGLPPHTCMTGVTIQI